MGATSLNHKKNKVIIVSRTKNLLEKNRILKNLISRSKAVRVSQLHLIQVVKTLKSLVRSEANIRGLFEYNN